MNGKMVAAVCTIVSISSCIGSLLLLSTVDPPPLLPPHENPRRNAGEEQLLYEVSEKVIRPFDSLVPFYRFNPEILDPSLNVTSVRESVFVLPVGPIRKVVPPPHFIQYKNNGNKSSFFPKNITVEIKNNEAVPGNALGNYDGKMGTIKAGVTETRLDLIWDENRTNLTPSGKSVRRSVDANAENEFKTNRSIIISIVNKIGKHRIVIELRPNMDMQVKANETKGEIIKLRHNTTIELLPNDTVLIREVDNVNDSIYIVQRPAVKGVKNYYGSKFFDVPHPTTHRNKTNIFNNTATTQIIGLEVQNVPNKAIESSINIAKPNLVNITTKNAYTSLTSVFPKDNITIAEQT